MVTKKKISWTSKTSSPDLSQLATLWGWQKMRRNAISLEVISEDAPLQCGWTLHIRVSTIGEAFRNTSWSDTEEKCKQLHSVMKSLNSFKIKLKLSVFLPSAFTQLRTWRCQPQTGLKPETMNGEWWLTLSPAKPLTAAKRQYILKKATLNVPDSFKLKYLDLLLKYHKVISDNKYNLGKC